MMSVLGIGRTELRCNDPIEVVYQKFYGGTDDSAFRRAVYAKMDSENNAYSWVELVRSAAMQVGECRIVVFDHDDMTFCGVGCPLVKARKMAIIMYSEHGFYLVRAHAFNMYMLQLICRTDGTVRLNKYLIRCYAFTFLISFAFSFCLFPILVKSVFNTIRS